MKIGFIGLGAMGKHMAQNLLKAGYVVFVYDVAEAAVKEVSNVGAKGCTSPKELAQSADVIITSLPNAKIVQAVLTEDYGVLAGSHPGQIIVDMSSVSPESSRQMAKLAAEKDVRYVDAPVSGGVLGAQKGTLTIMVGGDTDTVKILEPVFKVLGEKIYHVGSIGSGDAIKLVNNLLLGCNMAAVAEALVLGVKAGLSPQKMYEIIKNSSGRSYAFDVKTSGFILPRSFAPGFAVDLQYKDLELALETAKSMGVPLPVTAVSQQVFEMARAKGLNKEDVSAIIKVWEDLTGVQVKE